MIIEHLEFSYYWVAEILGRGILKGLAWSTVKSYATGIKQVW